ncbi:MAG: glycosyltransferase family 1 protein, partial [Gemmatimonadota bacterium]|nr:glycosyltransferase family 1 protein [Gemmatimonadota bacterium]
MKVLFLVPYPKQGASNRFRVMQYVPYLESRGIGCRVRPFYSEKLWRILYQPGYWIAKLVLGLVCTLNRLLDLVRAGRSDLVFIHREAYPLGPAWFERALC